LSLSSLVLSEQIPLSSVLKRDEFSILIPPGPDSYFFSIPIPSVIIFFNPDPECYNYNIYNQRNVMIGKKCFSMSIYGFQNLFLILHIIIFLPRKMIQHSGSRSNLGPDLSRNFQSRSRPESKFPIPIPPGPDLSRNFRSRHGSGYPDSGSGSRFRTLFLR
jgi:hypothetical protein